jgi:hypothetical protein
VAPEQPQQPAPRRQQPTDGGDVSVAAARIDGAEAGVLHDPAEASGRQARRLQGLLVKQVGLQPAQSGPIRAVQGAGFGQGLAAEIQADGAEAKLLEQGGLMAAAAARHQHRPRRPGSEGMATQEPLQRRSRPAQFPAVGALPVALVPVAWLSGGCRCGGVHGFSMARCLAAGGQSAASQ